jgi:type VI secretion system secreted protein Hcp
VEVVNMRILSRRKLWLLTCILAISALPLDAANDIFVKVDGLTCESLDQEHKNWFDAITFSFGAEGVPSTATAGGAASAKATAGDVVVLKNFDKCTPGLLKQLARGTYIREVLFDWQTSVGDRRVVFMKIKLEEATVASVNYSANQEAVGFSWVRMTLTYIPLDPKGMPGAPVMVVWDRMRGTAN